MIFYVAYADFYIHFKGEMYNMLAEKYQDSCWNINPDEKAYQYEGIQRKNMINEQLEHKK